MLYEIHMLKNYPPTNLNRDDTGAPKTCLFGGTMRGRVSSQCLKRSWRTAPSFRSEIGDENLGIRTRKLPVLVAEKLVGMGVSQEFADAIQPRLTGIGNKEGKETKDGNATAQVIFYAKEDITAVAETVKELLDKCKSVKDVQKLKAKDIQAAVSGADVRPVTLDIALFGRMVTSDAFRDVEASMQVAHAISTNKVSVESDYFTAMDDMLSGSSMDELGAAMIGDVDFNSSCYYVYASIDTDALAENLKYAENADEILCKAIPALLRAMAFTDPSGKQNSFAGHVLPSVVMVECKEKKIPTSMVNAFVEPVGKGGDLVKQSARKLADEVDMTARNFGLEVRERLWFCVDKYDVKPETATKVCATFPELVEAVAASL
ncbi:MAG: type I-E CRISPR-associated protein Cas7/Cse4/CasC [Oscillospiraceae bacterium]|nr:type I-E CRISPR-associated protein Cas7/Cse4/CasC [Oscillospiraceae bacterium]